MPWQFPRLGIGVAHQGLNLGAKQTRVPGWIEPHGELVFDDPRLNNADGLVEERGGAAIRHVAHVSG
jgi:hypothetical protein